jgi:hypothetical protein
MTVPHPEDHPLRSALAELVEVKGSGEDCPEAALLWDSATERLSGKRNVAIVRHLGECTACGVAWELARDLGPAVSRPAVVSGSRPGWLPLAAAAVLVLGLTGVWLYEPWRPGEPPASYRDPAPAWLVAGLPADAVLAREACTLRWAAGPEGTTYDVVVTSEELRPLARTFGLDRPEHLVDAADLAPVAPGGKILWRVTAHLATGQDVVSATFIHVVE